MMCTDLDRTLAGLRTMYGAATVSIGPSTSFRDVAVVPTGLRELDGALTRGGIPCGRLVEIFGGEGVGKTTLILRVLSAFQPYGTVAYMDADHALEATYAARLGVEVDRMIFCRPRTAEEAIDVTAALAACRSVAAIAVDSVAALVPQSEADNPSPAGTQAHLLAAAWRRLVGCASRSGACVLLVNQLRDRAGIMFGRPETTTGGRALRFYASLRLELRRTQTLGDPAHGQRVTVSLVKNKLGRAHRRVELDLIYGEGFRSLSVSSPARVPAAQPAGQGALVGVRAGSIIHRGEKEVHEDRRNDMLLGSCLRS
jgi:recombination protein RecA